MKSYFLKRMFYTLLLCFLIYIINCTDVYAKNNNFKYKIDNSGQATITAYIGFKGNVTIPSIIDGHKVKDIGEHAFDESRNSTNGKKLVNVVISEGIKSIGDFAFVGCNNLETVKLPNSLENIGDQTFINCSNLKKINIPPKVKTLGETGYMFQECGFASFTVPATIKKIPSYTFRICTGLKDFIVYSKNVELGNSLFEHGSKDLTIHGYKGSTAETYAKENNYKFRSLATTHKSNIRVKSVKLQKKSYKILVGQKIKLKATVLPTDATNKRLKWASNNTTIATIKNGIVKALKPGKAKLVVATVDGNYKDYCLVTIVNKKKTSIPNKTIKPNKTKNDETTSISPLDTNDKNNDKSEHIKNTSETTKTKKKPIYKKIINKSSPVPFLIIFIPLTIMFVVDIFLIVKKKMNDNNDDDDDDDSFNDNN